MNIVKQYGLWLATVVLALAFAVIVFLVAPGAVLLDVLFVSLMFGVGVGLLLRMVQEVMVNFLRQLYKLSYEDAEGVLNRIMFGLPTMPPMDPILGVKEGHVDPDGPEVMRKIGGPGYLSVSFENAAITTRAGRLERILGPGFHALKPFEQVWDVIDLRPQRRTVTASALTKDGIPVSCQADIRFRIDSGENEPTEDAPYPFSEDAVLIAAVKQRVRLRSGRDRVIPWTNRIAGGVLEGALKDRLEKFRLDDLLSIQDRNEAPWAALEAELEAEVKKSALELGVKVERVHVGSVLPAEEEISQQWLETWQAEWHQQSAAYLLAGEISQADALEKAQLNSQIEMLSLLQQTMQNLSRSGEEIQPELIVLRFLDVMRSLTVNDPMMRVLMPQQADNLLHTLDTLQKSLNKPQLSGGK